MSVHIFNMITIENEVSLKDFVFMQQSLLYYGGTRCTISKAADVLISLFGAISQ